MCRQVSRYPTVLDSFDKQIKLNVQRATCNEESFATTSRKELVRHLRANLIVVAFRSDQSLNESITLSYVLRRNYSLIRSAAYLLPIFLVTFLFVSQMAPDDHFDPENRLHTNAVKNKQLKAYVARCQHLPFRVTFHKVSEIFDCTSNTYFAYDKIRSSTIHLPGFCVRQSTKDGAQLHMSTDKENRPSRFTTSCDLVFLYFRNSVKVIPNCFINKNVKL